MQRLTLGHPRRVRGFTMIEAVVSLAIVLLTVAALLPVLSEARTQAVASACLANQMALGIASGEYVANYAQLPGIHYQEGTYWSKPWGQASFYGGIQAWMANGDDFWNDYLYGSNANKPSGLSGIGYVYPYIGGDGKTFYCPGTTASFESSATTGNAEYIENSHPWYSTWTGEHSNGLTGFGEQGKGTIITYFYRSGMYDRDKTLPDTDPRWGGWQAAGSNWTWLTVSRPTDPWVANKPMLTCFWYGYRDDGEPTWNQLQPDVSTMNHDGSRTNLLYTDGSARTWELPADISPVWGWFDGLQYNKAQFRTGSLTTGFIVGSTESDFYHQMPWWWIEAERANQ